MAVNFYATPYFDDFDEAKKFLKVLYRPGVAVQVRELNQLQTILQNQVSRFANHIFKDGAMVIPGQVAIDTNIGYVKLQPLYNSVPVENYRTNFVGTVITGQTSGVQAVVVATAAAEGSDPITLMVQYLNAGTSTTATKFANGENLFSSPDIVTLTIEDLKNEFQKDERVTQTLSAEGIVLLTTETSVVIKVTNGAFTTNSILTGGFEPSLRLTGANSGATANVTLVSGGVVLGAAAEASDATGVGSVTAIQPGIYYIKGYFVKVDGQILILDKYSNLPSYRIGLSVSETAATPEEDLSLRDNASGSFNYAAPGAHRYKISLTLAKLPLTSTADSAFIELIRVVNGVVQYKVQTTDYSVLEKTLARRTFDASGNFTIRPFQTEVREHRNNNRGQWVTNRDYLIGDIVFNGPNYYTALNAGTSGNNTLVHTAGNASDGTVQWNHTTTPLYNRGIYTPEAGGREDKLAIGVEPGKAYINGYEIEKIATEYVTVNKARAFTGVNSDLIETRVGNYILVTNVTGVPNITQFVQVDLYDQLTTTGGTAAGAKVGTARIRAFEFDSGTTGTATCVYKLSVFDVQMNSGKTFERNVKQIYLNNNSAYFNFTADVKPSLIKLTGSITASGTTVTGTGTLFIRDLVVGDYIQVTTSSGIEVRRVTVISSGNLATIASAFSGTLTAAAVFDRVQTAYIETNNLPLLYDLGQFAIRKVRSAADDIAYETSYIATQRFDAVTTAAGVLTINLGAPTDPTRTGSEFDPNADENNFVIINKTSGGIANPSTVAITTSQVVLEGLTASESFCVFAPVSKQDALGIEKSKTLNSNVTVDFTTAAAAQVLTLSLGKADIYRVVKIEMATGFGAFSSTGAIDIVKWYSLDDGQRPGHYDIGKLTRNSGISAPTGTVRVTFDYFTHSPGDYFSVDSYSTIEYSKIPMYISQSGTYMLSDVLDFRPRIDDIGVSFTGTGAGLSQLPRRNTSTRVDYTYYLPRIDKLSIDSRGNYFIIEGKSSNNLVEPADPTLGMVLNKLTLAPYTFSTSANNIQTEVVDNKRLTMRDIGRIEKRIENIEYYTALSLLEQETKSLQILDDSGLDRYKNGFIVDNFESQGIGDIASPDYKCSVNMENNELRSFFTMDNCNLVEENNTTATRTTAGYAITGDIITLPYTHSSFISQPYASRTENVNPFAVFTFLGTTALTPASDEWFETDRRPDIIIEQEGTFAATKTVLEAAGALGTVWNSWQNQWTGVTTFGATRMERVADWSGQDFGLGAGRWMNRNTFTAEQVALIGATAGGRVLTWQTSATTTGQARSGVRTNVIARIDRRLIEDRVLSTAVIPFIRARKVLFLTRGMKPDTRVYPFFDDVAIGSYITPASKFAYSAVSGFGDNFDFTSNVGSSSTDAERQVAGDTQVSYTKGDVLFVKVRAGVTYSTAATSPATAVCVLQETSNTGAKAVYVLNIKGTFQTGDVIEGTISSARGSISAITLKSKSDALTSNFNGDVVGVFDIPSTDSVRFRTGIREFKLSDSATAGLEFLTQSRVQYRAQGVLETRQSTIAAVRNAEVVQEKVSESRTVTSTSTRLIGDTGWYDPLAQTFLIQSVGGAFITKADVFFATMDVNIPVTLQIREVVNGYPGKVVLPFSRVTLTPDKVNTSDDSSVATTFTFESPIYLQDNVEYCIVLLSDSNNYRVWISQLGEKHIGTDRFISEQPYMGVLFKSQNASTWTAEQMQDLKFTIYKAQFNTTTEGRVPFVNDQVNLSRLPASPFTTTNGSAIIRVFHRNHGMFADSSVTFAAAIDTNGITAAQLNTTHSISNVELDSYTITTTGTATVTSVGGGEVVTATRNVVYTAVQPIVQTQQFSDTKLTFAAITSSGKSIHGSETPYQISSVAEAIAPNENNFFTSPRVIASSVNQTVNQAGKKSFKLTATMTSSNANVSPVIDTNRTSLITVYNRINNPDATNTNVTVIDDKIIVTGVTGFIFNVNKTINIPAAARPSVLTIKAGKYIVVTGTTSNNKTYLVTDINTDGSAITVAETMVNESPTATTIVLKDRFVHELATVGGSAEARYLTKAITLANPSNFVKIQFAQNCPPSANIEIYYKTMSVSSGIAFNTVEFLGPLTPKAALVKTANYDQFTELTYEFENLNTLGNPVTFDVIAIKIVFKSTNSAEIPRVKDFRVIACA